MRPPLRHRSARWRLPVLLDGGLPEAEAGALRRHAAGCRRCRRRLRELEASERLLRRLPRALLAPDRAGEARLAALARWAPPPRAGLAAAAAGLPALGAVAAAAALVLLLWGTPLGPPGAETERPIRGVAAVPESTLFPSGWR